MDNKVKARDEIFNSMKYKLNELLDEWKMSFDVIKGLEDISTRVDISFSEYKRTIFKWQLKHTSNNIDENFIMSSKEFCNITIDYNSLQIQMYFNEKVAKIIIPDEVLENLIWNNYSYKNKSIIQFRNLTFVITEIEDITIILRCLC